MDLFSFALRNIARNRQRALITIGSMAFAGSVMIFFAALGEGLMHTMEINAVGMTLGDIQVHAPGYRSDPDLYTRIENPDALIGALESKGFRASARLYGFGLAAAGNASSGIMLRGVDMRHEPSVTLINRHVLAGKWLDDADPKGVVIGKKLAHTLGAKTGSEIVVVSQAADGSMANDIYRVRGIFKSVGEGIDRGGFFMTEAEFRRLMSLPAGAHEIAVARERPTDNLTWAAATVAAAAPGLEVKDWRQLQPVVANLIENANISLYIMLSIAYSAVGMIILNAMLMNVFERIHEFGVMKAVGILPWQVFALIALEALLQAGIASLLAVAAAIPVVLHYQQHGVDLSALSPGGSLGGVAFEPVWYCQLTPNAVFTPTVFMFVMVLVAVLYPAAKAALIRPLEALHYQ
jgi:ABC-type lipoprotein release transport system permease subunit